MRSELVAQAREGSKLMTVLIIYENCLCLLSIICQLTTYQNGSSLQLSRRASIAFLAWLSDRSNRARISCPTSLALNSPFSRNPWITLKPRYNSALYDAVTKLYITYIWSNSTIQQTKPRWHKLNHTDSNFQAWFRMQLYNLKCSTQSDISLNVSSQAAALRHCCQLQYKAKNLILHPPLPAFAID